MNLDAYRRFLRTLWKTLGHDYVQTWMDVAEHGAWLPSQSFVRFTNGVEQVFQWATIDAAARLRWKAIRDALRISPNITNYMDRLSDEAERREELGELPDQAWRHQAETVIPRVADENAWVRAQQVRANPFVAERAAQVADIEQYFIEERAKSLATAPKALPLYRLEMLRRDSIGTVTEEAQQVQLADPRIGDAMPMCRYNSREDRRVRPTHAAMDGFLALRTWNGWPLARPLCGWNCRCLTQFFSVGQCIERGWFTANGTPKWELRWPNPAAEANWKQHLFPDPGTPFSQEKAWAFPGNSQERAA